MPRISGFEELVLWNQPKSGLVLPVDLIPVADKDDLIILPPQCRSEKEDSLRPAWANGNTISPELRDRRGPERRSPDRSVSNPEHLLTGRDLDELRALRIAAA